MAHSGDDLVVDGDDGGDYVRDCDGGCGYGDESDDDGSTVVSVAAVDNVGNYHEAQRLID